MNTESAPKPVGLYPHARRVGDLLSFRSRSSTTRYECDSRWSIRDGEGRPLDYDIKAQTRAVVENIARILDEAGSSMEKVVDVTSFLVDMDRDFAGYNEVWAETLGHYGPTRTTLAIRAL